MDIEVTIVTDIEANMNKKEFIKVKKEAWVAAEKQYGIRVALSYRKNYEKENFPHYDETPREDIEYIINSIVRWLSMFQSSLERKAPSVSSSKSTKGKNRKFFERRAYMVDFVASKARSSKGGVIRTIAPQRHNWKFIIGEWNKKHPDNPMTIPVLKAEYYRAIREDPIMLAFILPDSSSLYKVLEKRYGEEYADDIFSYMAKEIKNIERRDNLLDSYNKKLESEEENYEG